MRRLLVLLSTLTAGVLFALPAVPGSAGTGGHAAITITSNADFLSCGCVTSGNGTAASPFIIGPWAINAPSGGTSGYSVKVDNSHGKITDYFNIVGISSTYNDTTTTDPTIWLVGVTTRTTISGASGNGLSVGIELDSSSNISIDGASYNKGNGTGVYINGSSNVSINHSKFKATCNVCTPHTGDGIYAVGSSNLNIGTGADCPQNTPCNDVTYDDGFGIYLQDTHDVVINQATADANDTGGYVLDGTGTYNVTLENSGSQGGGSICHTYLGQKLNTGYTTDLQGGLHRQHHLQRHLHQQHDHGHRQRWQRLLLQRLRRGGPALGADRRGRDGREQPLLQHLLPEHERCHTRSPALDLQVVAGIVGPPGGQPGKMGSDW